MLLFLHEAYNYHFSLHAVLTLVFNSKWQMQDTTDGMEDRKKTIAANI